MTSDDTSNNPLFARLNELEQETDFEFVVELIDIFLGETPKHIQTITSALRSQDYSALTIAAHTLKGSSLNLGAKRLGSLSLEFEEIGRSHSLISSEMNTQEIEKEYEAVVSMLDVYKKRNT